MRFVLANVGVGERAQFRELVGRDARRPTPGHGHGAGAQCDVRREMGCTR